MIKHYKYEVTGSGANGQTWKAEGVVSSPFEHVFTHVMKECFDKITKGKAIYGKPGLSCQGPYDFHKIMIEQIMH